MRGLRFLQLSAVLFTLAAAGQAHAIASLELEAGGGTNFRGDKAPLVSARAGVDLLSSFTLSLRGQFALGSDPATNAGKGYKGWALFPELRLRAPIPFVQPDLAIGVGTGHLNGISLGGLLPDANDGSHLYAQFGIGVRINIPTTSLYLRPEGSISMWTGVGGPDVNNGTSTGNLYIYNLQLLIGYSIGF